MAPKTTVLRLNHRAFRDKRISTHCALVARTFGASKMVYSGDHDSDMEESVQKVVQDWGGPFEIEHITNWRKFIKDFKGEKVHLTMYGLPFEKNFKASKKDQLIIVGGAHVPGEVYEMADYNFAVTSQPHSEIAALAVFLDHTAKKPTLKNAKKYIEPQAKGKKVILNES